MTVSASWAILSMEEQDRAASARVAARTMFNNFFINIKRI
jgi:hypothetical protein